MTAATRKSKRLELSRAEAAAAPPPARRARRTDGPVPPAEREAFVPAARVTRPASPPHRKGVSDDVAAAPSPAPRRTEDDDPPPMSLGSGRITLPRVRYVLRSRHVPDTSNPKPLPHASYEKGSFREEVKRGRRSWQTPMCARVGLEYYNTLNQGDQHELVKAVSSNAFVFNGIWFHANFLAKRKGATNCVDLVPKYFFAEIESTRDGHSCVSCVKLDQGEPQNIGGCRLCSERMMHPAGRGYHGAQPRTVRRAPGGLQISFKF